MVDLEKNVIEIMSNEIKNELKLNSNEQKFCEDLLKHVKKNIMEEEKDWKYLNMQLNNSCWEGSNDFIRVSIKNYLFSLITEFTLFTLNLSYI